jgi:hypothetical protein
MNAGLQISQRDEDLRSLERDEYELAHVFQSTMKISATEPNSEQALNFYKDSKEVETITLQNDDTLVQKRISFAISECISGNLSAISQYLNTSAEAKLLLHGKDETGNTTLIMAAAEKNQEMVSLLLQNGAEVNAINNDGRSALMEAALWGRVKSVKALLNSNADKHLRDHQGRCAVDLAQPTRKNEKERYQRSRRAAAESVPEYDRDRRHIVILLSDSNAEKQYAYTTPLSKTERNNYCLGNLNRGWQSAAKELYYKRLLLANYIFFLVDLLGIIKLRE